MKKTLIALIAGTIFLAGCTTVATPSLQEQMQGKTKVERTEFLKEKCHEEASYRHMGMHRNYSSAHISRMTEICNAMSDEMTKNK
ncbi:MAG TPA: hypothetical protein PKW15_06840 [Alphaproteobacteria bacterium]|nr:hypothetical protein [Alphaproteobacteria bacterium]